MTLPIEITMAIAAGIVGGTARMLTSPMGGKSGQDPEISKLLTEAERLRASGGSPIMTVNPTDYSHLEDYVQRHVQPTEIGEPLVFAGIVVRPDDWILRFPKDERNRLWRPRDGEIRHVRHLRMPHLRNIIAYLERTGDDSSRSYGWLCDEEDRRMFLLDNPDGSGH